MPSFFWGAIFLSGFQEDESPMAETGGASFSFKLPDGSIREAGSSTGLDSRQNVERDLGDNRCLEPKKPDFSQMLMVQNFRVLHHSICSEKNSHHYIWLFAGSFDTSQVVIAGYLNYQHSSPEKDPSGISNHHGFANLRWTKCWEFLQITGCSSKHRRGHWNTIRPRYMWFWPPRKNVVFDDVSKHLVRFF